MLKHLDLFSGIGSFTLACQWAGVETIAFVEIDKYCQKVLRKHWSDVPIVEDIKNVEEIKKIITAHTNIRGLEGSSPKGQGADNAFGDSGETGTKEIKQIVTNASSIGFRSRCGDRQRGYIQADKGVATQSKSQGQRRLGGAWQVSSNGTPDKRCRFTNQPTILITAGFPCQPFSVAGKRQGERDDRYLWPETLAVIEAIKPDWILLENVTGIINLALDTVLSDLEGAGYSTETLIIPACAVNAWHRRDRVWIIAHSERAGTWQDNGGVWQRSSGIGGGQESVTTKSRLFGQTKRQKQTTGIAQCDWWAVEPELGRVAHGIPNRVDRLKCLGNAIVPQVAYEIIKVIKEISEN